MNNTNQPIPSSSDTIFTEEEKTNSPKRIYLRSEDKFVEVSEDVYYAYYRPVWRIHDREKRMGRCMCTKAQLWQCDGDCCDCSFHHTPDTVSETLPVSGSSDSAFADYISSEELNPANIAIYHDLVSTLKKEIDALSPEQKTIFVSYLSGMTEREIASLLNKSQVAVNKSKHRILSKLRKRLSDYLL